MYLETFLCFSDSTTFVIQFLPVFDRTIRKMEWGELAASGAVSLKLDVMCLKLSSCSVQMVFARTWNVWNSQDWCIYRDRFSTSRTEKILMELFREYEIYTSTLHHCFFFSFLKKKSLLSSFRLHRTWGSHYCFTSRVHSSLLNDCQFIRISSRGKSLKPFVLIVLKFKLIKNSCWDTAYE